MSTCQELTENIEKGNVRKLSIRERIAIRRHLKLCPDCKQYSKDSKILDRLLRLKSKQISEYKFSPEEKAELIKKLK